MECEIQRNSLLLSAVILALGAGSAYGQAESTSDEIETPAAQSQPTTETRTRTTESQDAESAPDADFVVMSDSLSPWPVASVGELTMLIENRLTRGYTVVFERSGWTVLRRGAAEGTSNDVRSSGR